MSALTAKDLMSENVFTIGPLTEIGEAARLLTERRITGAPVVDKEGRLLGVVSQTDITHFLGHPSVPGWEDENAARESKPVAAVMTDRAVTCDEDTPLEVLADLMLNRRIHRVIVTRSGRLCGIVSSMDLLRALPSASGALRDPLHCRW